MKAGGLFFFAPPSKNTRKACIFRESPYLCNVIKEMTRTLITNL